MNGWEGCSKDGQRSPRRRAACGGAERGAADQQRPLGLSRRTIESTGGARSSGPCRRWCGDTGCGLVLLATDEREVKELRQSRQKSITCRTRTATSPSAQKSSAKTFGRIVRAGELSERSDLVSAILNMCAGWAPQPGGDINARATSWHQCASCPCGRASMRTSEASIWKHTLKTTSALCRVPQCGAGCPAARLHTLPSRAHPARALRIARRCWRSPRGVEGAVGPG